jgi:hypothetical protein
MALRLPGADSYLTILGYLAVMTPAISLNDNASVIK